MSYRIDSVNTLSPFILFAFYPVSIKVRKQSVYIVRTSGVSVPLFRVVSQKILVNKGICTLTHRCQIDITQRELRTVITSRTVFKWAIRYFVSLLYKSEPIKFAPAVEDNDRTRQCRANEQ